MHAEGLKSTPWDVRLARLLVRPLVGTRISPNHLTSLSLMAGLAAFGLFSSGSSVAADWGALAFMLAALLDHADGELARMANKTSRFGYYYDHLSGALVYVALFAGIGLGLRGELGGWAILPGLAAGIAVAGIFTLRFGLERRHGADTFEQPAFAHFEIEDLMYLIGPITWFDGLIPFLIAAGIGAPLYGLWMLWQYARNRGTA